MKKSFGRNLTEAGCYAMGAIAVVDVTGIVAMPEIPIPAPTIVAMVAVLLGVLLDR